MLRWCPEVRVLKKTLDWFAGRTERVYEVS
jgi:hypothetical protein